MSERGPAASFPALGTTAVVLVDDSHRLETARRVVESHIGAVDRACSRFREDSELSRLNRADGKPTVVSPVLLDALEAALDAARLTGGLVDPTLGVSMRELGYDRDFASVPADGPAMVVHLPERASWEQIFVDRRRQVVMLPPHVELDLGATAKAWCADRAAAAAADETAGGVLVSLGGDMAMAGPTPAEGWTVRITDDHASDPETSPGPIVALHGGGLATSGTAVRRWQRGDRSLHHLLDPHTGLPADSCWRTVTVAAASCLAANVASTASMILGDDAEDWLAALGLPGRLVRADGTVELVGDWPSEQIGVKAC